MSELRTFRGKGLEEVLPAIRQELGPDAVVLARREVLEGGVGGFFAKRLVEVDAVAPGGLDVRADEVAMPEAPLAADGPDAEPADFGALLERHGGSLAGPPPEDEPTLLPGPTDARPPEPEPDPRLDAPPTPSDPLPTPTDHVASTPLPGPADDDLDLLVGLQPAPDAGRAEDLVTALVERGLSPELAHALQEELPTDVGPTPALLVDALARRIDVAPPRPAASGSAVAFVGAGGSGKTRSTAALATAFATRSAIPVSVVALRPGDRGEELARLLEGTQVDLHVVEDARDLHGVVADHRTGRLVVVDTPGTSPRDRIARGRLADELAAVELDATYGCLPATTGAGPGREVVEGLRELGADALVLTHADETSLPGGAVELTLDASLPVALVGRSSSPRAGLRPAVATELAEAVLG